MNADYAVIKLRHRVLEEAAKLAFEGRFEEEVEYLPEKLYPGPLPTVRCCVYREREVTRQRLRLIMDKSPDRYDNGNTIQVMDPACSDCPISGYLVTETCQNCMGKSCISSCKFDAIHVGPKHTVIDKQKCKECGMCAKSCPYHAIIHIKRPCKNACPVDAIHYDEYGLAKIDEEKCIRCGLCIHSCPFGAIGKRNHIIKVIDAIREGKRVYAMFAPATEGQYGKDITMGSFRVAAKKVGFYDMMEVGLGADLTTASEAEEWHEAYEKGECKTTSCCPAFVNMIRKHYPELSDMISTSVSPMCQLSRMIKAKDPEAVTVFIGPCIAKKSEIVDQKIEGNADYALVYSEFEAMMKAKDVWLEPCSEPFQQSSKFAKRYANAGGVADSCLQYKEEQGWDDDWKVLKVSGAQELKKTLELAKRGKMLEVLHAQFIEGMCCEGGCFNGPSSFDCTPKAKRVRDEMIDAAKDLTIGESLKDVDRETFSGHR
ncbi:MAG: 4Fe-4S dicluster domain-containing protein [Lachnospiraceae bacterium]|nr:4Fe-4S dicluster domain-containing protein [Lachnospiraceae bacterium]